MYNLSRSLQDCYNKEVNFTQDLCSKAVSSLRLVTFADNALPTVVTLLGARPVKTLPLQNTANAGTRCCRFFFSIKQHTQTKGQGQEL